MDNKYLFIHDDLFDRILETEQNSDIVLNVINNDISLPKINENGTDSRSKLGNRFEIVIPHHQFQRKRQKNFMII